MATAIHSLSYNQLVETIIDNKHSVDPELVSAKLRDYLSGCKRLVISKIHHMFNTNLLF